MHKSLKKQIHITKISKIFKTHDIILFFAFFDLPQKNRQLLKKQGYFASFPANSKVTNLYQPSLLSKGEGLQKTLLGPSVKDQYPITSQKKGETNEIVNSQQPFKYQSFLSNCTFSTSFDTLTDSAARSSNIYNSNKISNNSNKYTGGHTFDLAASSDVDVATHTAKIANIFRNKLSNAKRANIENNHCVSSTKGEQCKFYERHIDLLQTAIGDLTQNDRGSKKGENIILHLNNKCAQYSNIHCDLTLSGQTLAFAILDENDAQYIFTTAKSLYKGVFLGGFYKNKYKTNLYIKSLCNAIFHKNEIYKMFCKVLFLTNYKNVYKIAQVYVKFIFLLNLIEKLKRKVLLSK